MSGPYCGLNGIILRFEDHFLSVDVSELGLVQVQIDHVRRVLSTGDNVRVMVGHFVNKTGIVLAVAGTNVTLYDIGSEPITVPQVYVETYKPDITGGKSISHTASARSRPDPWVGKRVIIINGYHKGNWAEVRSTSGDNVQVILDCNHSTQSYQKKHLVDEGGFTLSGENKRKDFGNLVERYTAAEMPRAPTPTPDDAAIPEDMNLNQAWDPGHEDESDTNKNDDIVEVNSGKRLPTPPPNYDGPGRWLLKPEICARMATHRIVVQFFDSMSYEGGRFDRRHATTNTDGSSVNPRFLAIDLTCKDKRAKTYDLPVPVKFLQPVLPNKNGIGVVIAGDRSGTLIFLRRFAKGKKTAKVVQAGGTSEWDEPIENLCRVEERNA
ncbi:hypothetical protein BD410DRAFT_807218 [Rickenella mellea]|uniref:KOW domain-containing protein n=1 Tax=Rickenella mellea TaxID=50990 RepID=A0A4Y7PSS0_9AGAM|nr:hypothetical protein BD410DRAFT_807218 [Rickenella mellea]